MDTAPSSPSGPTCGYEPSPWRPPTPASSQLVESGSAAWGRGSRRRLAAARFGMAEGSGRRGSGAAGKGRKGTSPECRWLGRARSKPRRGHVCLALPRSCVSGPAEVRFFRGRPAEVMCFWPCPSRHPATPFNGMCRPGQELGEPLPECLGTPRGRHAQAGRRVWSGRPSRAPPLCFWPTIESEGQHGDNGDAEHLAGHVAQVHVVEQCGGRGASGHPHHEHVRVAGQ